MEKAKQAVSNFVAGDGKHTTDVHQDVKPAVTEEHIHPHRHENVTQAVDREVHRDHHHTVVQPITHREQLPEKHIHNAAPVEHKEFHHGNEKDLHASIEREHAKFKDNTVTHDTRRTATTAPVVEARHTHHHIHEHIQPVIQKETHAPEVVHTTVPVHETHHAEGVHHGTHVLPPKTLDEFGGNREFFQGRGLHKVAEYEGCPSEYSKDLRGGKEHDGLEGAGGARTGSARTGARGAETRGANAARAEGGEYEGRSTRSRAPGGDVAAGTEGTAKKPSLLDRINPLKDADGDGKKGLLD